ncbi:hypothetical protein ACFW81_06635 [Streptomyces angustmyceticus]|uniref:hypothetical protein n=1 Tax=Streptomyces angustmyceticus TaxID=285578 RepID=UPI0036BF054F
MTRNGDYMTALLDSRRALSEEISSVGQRLDDSRREVLDAITTESGNLRNEARETRNRANNAATAVGETNKAVAALHHEVSEIAGALAVLQRSLDALARQPVFQTSEPTSAPANAPAPITQSDASAPAIAGGEGHTPLAPEAGAPSDRVEPHEETDTQQPGDTAADPTRQPASEVDAPTSSPVTPAVDAAEETADGDADAMRLHNTQEQVDHGALLLTAAVTGRVALICHREAWDFLAACASENEHFCKTTEVCDEGDGRIRAVLSGRSVIGLLIALRNTRTASSLDGTWALASAFYHRLAEDLTTTSRHGTQPLTVIFDDGVHDHTLATETPA